MISYKYDNTAFMPHLLQVSGPDTTMPNNLLISAPVQDKPSSLMESSAVVPEGSGKPIGKHIINIYTE